MSEWAEVLLEDVVNELTVGYVGPMASEYVDDGIPFLRSLNIEPLRIKKHDLKYISAEFHHRIRKSRLTPGDVVIVRTGKPGACAVIPDWLADANCSDLVIVRCGEQIDNRFLAYYVNTVAAGHVAAHLVGAVQQHFNVGSARSLKISLPPLPEQKAIAAVLSSLDDKIDLLHRQNKTLEAIAETLFRQWFVEEAQENWEFAELGNYVNCFNGVSYKSDDLNPSTIAMVTLKSFDRDGGFRLDGFKEFTGKYKEQHVVIQGDLVVAHTDITQDAAVIGNPVLVVSDPAYDKLVISMDLVKVTSKYEWLSNVFLYRMMRNREFKQHCLGFSNGSTVLHLSKEAIPSYEFFLPPKDKIEEFTNLAKGLLGKKFENITQARTLEKLRDNLLPKLMSGEVRVAA